MKVSRAYENRVKYTSSLDELATLDAKKLELEKVTKELGGLKREHNLLKEKHDNERGSLVTVISEKSQEIARISTEKDVLARKVTQLEQAKAKLEEQLSILGREKARVEDLSKVQQKSVETLVMEKNTLQQALCVKENEMKNWKKEQHDKVNTECDKLEEELCKAWKTLNVTKEELASIKSEKANLENFHKAQIASLNDKHNEIAAHAMRYRAERNKVIAIVQNAQASPQ